MISEKVMGSNLRDFVMNGAYARLPDEQKEILLRAVARLVTLDLFVLGHTDRIHQMAENFSGFKKDEPSNIGNVMVEVSEATSEVLSLYAIDNSSIESEAEKSLYNTFLEGFNGDEQGVLNLAQNIQDSLTKAFAKDSKYLNGFVSSATNLDSLYESEIDRNPLVIEVKVRIEELKNELANVEYENTKDVEYAIEDAQSELSDVIEEVKSAVYKKHGVANRPIHFISDVKKFRAENAVFEFEIESVMNRLKSLNLELMVECCDSVNSVLSSAKSRINILKTRGVHA